MITSLKNFINTNEKKKLIENFISLSILQGANYILPLITLPYLVRVLGPEKFGLIAFAQSFIQYFNILTDYGFNLSATREISIHRENKEKVSEIFSSVMIIKLGLLILSFVIMTVIIFSFEKFRKDWLIYYLTFGIVIGQVLFPVWFFQGIERMKYITILNVTAKLLFTIFIFTFIKKPTDYYLVPFLNSMGFILVGVFSIFLIIKNFHVKLTFPSKSTIFNIFKEASTFFTIRISTTIYTASGTFLVGIFSGNTASAYYSVAEKVIRAFQWIMQPVFQTIFPYVSRLFQQSKRKAFNFIKKVSLGVGITSLILSLSIFYFSDFIIISLFGKEYLTASNILKILSFIPLIGNLTHIFGVETLQASGQQSVFLKSVFKATVLYLLFSPCFVYLWDGEGAGAILLIAETIVLLQTLVHVYDYYRRSNDGEITTSNY